MGFQAPGGRRHRAQRRLIDDLDEVVQWMSSRAQSIDRARCPE
jgi:hypothetical protein